MEKLIHIKAESEIYGFNAIVPEKDSVKVLTGIRNNFEYLALKYSRAVKIKGVRMKTGHHLKVQTCVHNPELFS